MTRNWPIQQTAEDLLRQMDRRITRGERRATPVAASDLLGPGMSSQAVHILDWNDEIATFNGFLYSLPGAHNIPVVEVWDYDPETGMPVGEPEEITDLPWTGCVIAREDGSGMQQVWNTDEPDSMFFRVRNYWPNPDDPEAPVIFGEWQRFATRSGWIEGDDLAPEVQDGITVTYETANEAALAAEEAAATATTAITAANGKNTVTYSVSAPGTTANRAGDIWFQKDPSTQTITHQFSGLGGTSWVEVQITNAVIANLDAGKLTAGSAFTNALSVKTLFTLGDASTNGIIQSYNFAGSSTGIYIDKFGFIAKGGEVIGSTVTGSLIRTAGPGSERLELDTTGGYGGMLFKNAANAVVGSVTMNSATGLRLAGTTALMTIDNSGVVISNVNTRVNADLIVGGTAELDGALDVAGVTDMHNNLRMNGNQISGITALLTSGLALDVPSIESSGTITASSGLFDLALADGSTYEARINGSGRLIRGPVVSSREHKHTIEDYRAPVYAPLRLRERTFFYNDTEMYGDDRQIGLVIEEMLDLGLDQFLFHDKDGKPTAIRYDRLVLALLPLLRDYNQRLSVLESR